MNRQKKRQAQAGLGLFVGAGEADLTPPGTSSHSLVMAYLVESLGWRGFTRIAVCLVSILFVVPANAARIRVAQESRPGAGDFDQHILGHIGALASGGRVDEAYAYDQLNRFSFNGERPVLRANVSHLFFVETVEGLTLFIVHDAVDDPDGGSAAVRIQIVGNRRKAQLLLRDDAFSPSDSYDVNEAGTDFHAWNSWYPCCTDGLVVGPFSGTWKIYVQFIGETQSAGAGAVEGLEIWEALSNNDRIPLALEAGRRVLLEPVDTFVFEPQPPRRSRPHNPFNRLRKNYFSPFARWNFSKLEGITDNNRILKKPVSKARGSAAAGAYSGT